MRTFIWAATALLLVGGGCATMTREQRAEMHQARAEQFALAGDARRASMEQEKANRLLLDRRDARANGYGRDDSQYPSGTTPPTLRAPREGGITP